MFDNLILLSMGKVVYHGVSSHALGYFSGIGYECEAHNNPPDFFLDIINGDSSAVKPAVKSFAANGRESYTPLPEKHSNGAAAVGIELSEEDLSGNLHTQYLKSDACAQVNAELQRLSEPRRGSSTVLTRQGDYATGVFTQFRYVSIRTLLNSIRNPATTVVQCAVMMVFAAITGLIYLQVDDYAPEGIQNRVGAFFFIIMNMIFGNLGAVELFIQERKIFVHENTSGFYSVAPYFFGKIFCDVIPLRCIPVIFFSLIVYFMIGLELAADKFFIFMLNLVLTTLCASSVGFFVSASVRVFAIANLLIALIYVFMMLFGGLLVNIDTIWVGIRWLQYFSIFKYSMYTLQINEFVGQMYYMKLENGTDVSVGYAGEEYMDNTGVPYGSDWDLWSNQVAILGMTIGFLTLAYIQLRRIPKWK